MTVTVLLDQTLRSVATMPFSRGVLPCPRSDADITLMVQREDLTTIKHHILVLSDATLFRMIQLAIARQRLSFIMALTYLMKNRSLAGYLRACINREDIELAFKACTTYYYVDVDNKKERYQRDVPPGYVVLGKVLGIVFGCDDDVSIDGNVFYQAGNTDSYFNLGCVLATQWPDDIRYRDLALLFSRSLGTPLTTFIRMAEQQSAHDVVAVLNERKVRLGGIMRRIGEQRQIKAQQDLLATQQRQAELRYEDPMMVAMRTQMALLEGAYPGYPVGPTGSALPGQAYYGPTNADQAYYGLAGAGAGQAYYGNGAHRVIGPDRMEE